MCRERYVAIRGLDYPAYVAVDHVCKSHIRNACDTEECHREIGRVLTSNTRHADTYLGSPEPTFCRSRDQSIRRNNEQCGPDAIPRVSATNTSARAASAS